MDTWLNRSPVVVVEEYLEGHDGHALLRHFVLQPFDFTLRDDIQTDIQTDRQADRQTDRQTDRQAGRHIHTHRMVRGTQQTVPAWETSTFSNKTNDRDTSSEEGRAGSTSQTLAWHATISMYLTHTWQAATGTHSR